MTHDTHEEGVSEVVGAVLLVGLTVLGVVIVAAVLLSGPQTAEIPHATIVAGNASGTIALVHEGGDPLREGEYRVYLDTGNGLVDETANFTTPPGGVWSIGEAINNTGSTKPERVVVTAVTGGGETILAEPAFDGGGAAGFAPDQVDPGTVTMTPGPTATLQEIIVSPDIMTDMDWKDYFDFAAKIERDDIERVDLIIYNYDDDTSGPDRKINSANAYEMTKSDAYEFYYNRTIHITGSIGQPGDLISITVIAYNATDIIASQSILSMIQ